MRKPKQHRFMSIQGLHILQPEPALRVLVLDISGICNFKCQYCYGEAESFKILCQPLQYGDYEQLLDEAVKAGVQTIWFLGAHENTLSPHYLRLLGAAETRGLFTVTFSNGAAFGDDVIAKQIFGLTAKKFTESVAVHSGASVVIKRDSQNPAIQSALASNDHATVQIETAIHNIQHTALWSPGVNGLPRFGLNSVLTTANYADIADVFRFCLKNKLAYFCDTLLISGAATDSLAPTKAQTQEALAKIDLAVNDYGFSISPEQIVNFYDEECVLFDNYLFINHDGGVLPCAGFPDTHDRLGHISDGLSVLWARKMQMVTAYHQCAGCTKCPCRTHLEDGLI
ncbi:MAG: hypothetical protein A2261_01810 [Candidatus Magasanikbacteria bacterium RIFOXYA2_FULL_44_8]|uniref:Radical SAM core domain-containing protein n=1 Tax=Candidatus Magasanikbacteria bacterium RIFOXYA2_FULL_44_8 TaxID=1798696 RepID=A0A1F6NLS1_9BACT|nr:MAG: hypothetical protein A2261_01810 [Candidatus Magasanikbacteria bacterium RIFOXYA2_FULL_44_8]